MGFLWTSHILDFQPQKTQKSWNLPKKFSLVGMNRFLILVENFMYYEGL